MGAVPAIPATGLVENQARTVSRREAGDAGGFDVQITLEGHLTPEQASPDSKDGTGVEYSLDGSTSEDPIDSHPNIRKLREIYQAEQLDDSGHSKWPLELPTDGLNGEVRNPMHGVESYLVPGLIWSRRYASRHFPTDLTSKRGANDPRQSAARRSFGIAIRVQRGCPPESF